MSKLGPQVAKLAGDISFGRWHQSLLSAVADIVKAAEKVRSDGGNASVEDLDKTFRAFGNVGGGVVLSNKDWDDVMAHLECRELTKIYAKIAKQIPGRDYGFNL